MLTRSNAGSSTGFVARRAGTYFTCAPVTGSIGFGGIDCLGGGWNVSIVNGGDDDDFVSATASCRRDGSDGGGSGKEWSSGIPNVVGKKISRSAAFMISASRSGRGSGGGRSTGNGFQFILRTCSSYARCRSRTDSLDAALDDGWVLPLLLLPGVGFEGFFSG
jgi:hypothetical protein